MKPTAANFEYILPLLTTRILKGFRLFANNVYMTEVYLQNAESI